MDTTKQPEQDYINVKQFLDPPPIPSKIKTPQEQLQSELSYLYAQYEQQNQYYSQKLDKMKQNRNQAFQNSLIQPYFEKEKDIPIDGDPIQGSQLFMSQCSGCHTLDADSQKKNTPGPALGLIMGKMSGSDTFYKSYSQNLLQKQVVWNQKNLFLLLQRDQQIVSGIKCGVKQFESNEDKTDLVKFLKVFKKAFLQNLKVRMIKNFGEDYLQSQWLSQKQLQEVGQSRMDKQQKDI